MEYPKGQEVENGSPVNENEVEATASQPDIVTGNCSVNIFMAGQGQE